MKKIKVIFTSLILLATSGELTAAKLSSNKVKDSTTHESNAGIPVSTSQLTTLYKRIYSQFQQHLIQDEGELREKIIKGVESSKEKMIQEIYNQPQMDPAEASKRGAQVERLFDNIVKGIPRASKTKVLSAELRTLRDIHRELESRGVEFTLPETKASFMVDELETADVVSRDCNLRDFLSIIFFPIDFSGSNRFKDQLDLTITTPFSFIFIPFISLGYLGRCLGLSYEIEDRTFKEGIRPQQSASM